MYLQDKIKQGVINLKSGPTAILLQWVQETESQRDADILSCEIMYRSER